MKLLPASLDFSDAKAALAQGLVTGSDKQASRTAKNFALTMQQHRYWGSSI